MIFLNNRNKHICRLSLFWGVAIIMACTSNRDIPENAYILEKVGVVCNNPEVNASQLASYIRQKPNTKLFSIIKKPGAAPVIYDNDIAARSADDINNALRSMGYLHAHTWLYEKTKKNKIFVTYEVTTEEPYYISHFDANIADEEVAKVINGNKSLLNPLRSGHRFSLSNVNMVRNNITALLQNNGYYQFNKDFIEFIVDTASTSTDVGVVMNIYKYKENRNSEETDHKRYTIGDINYMSSDGKELHLRKKVLENNTAFAKGEPFSSAALHKTYTNFAHLQAVRYASVNFLKGQNEDVLDCDILVNTNKPSTISFQPEGTNTAGDLGAAVTLGYENRNLFRGSEVLGIQGRAAYEAITGLEGYGNQKYQEYGIEAKLELPRFAAPFISHSFRRRNTATTEIIGAYNLQNRPEFHRRLFTGTLRYKWSADNNRNIYRLDMLDMNYVYMPWISETFKKDYLENSDNRNAILRYNYEDLFIMKIGFGVSVNHKNYSLRTNIETSGNVLHSLAKLTKFKQNEDGQYTLFKIAYAQYIKGDVDYTKLVNFDSNNQLALHAALGVAYPYGNSNILPFEKRYFTGGANSVRGWSVRSLGPGGFIGRDGRIDFINQTGDMKLDLSAEFRTKLFWKFNGAAFVDAGNIWTLRDYEDQAGGQFKINEFYKQIAVAYGLGVRLNFDYFILRFDFGMKAVNPAYETSREHYPIFHPSLSRDLAFHFAVGMPF